MLGILVITYIKSWSQVIENDYYSVQPAHDFKKEPAFIITHKAANLKRTILPKLQLVFTANQPELTGGSMDGQPGVVSWKTSKGATQDISTLGSVTFIARSYSVKGINYHLIFKKTLLLKYYLR